MNIPKFSAADVDLFKEWCMSNEEYIINKVSNVDSSISFKDMKINHAYLLVNKKDKGMNPGVIYIVEEIFELLLKSYGYLLGYFWKESFSKHNKSIPLWLWGGFRYIKKNTFGGYYIIPLTQPHNYYLNWPKESPLKDKQ